MEGTDVAIRCNQVTDTTYSISTPIKQLTRNTDNPLADSGATDAIFRMSDGNLLKDITTAGGKQVTYPDGHTATSIGTGTFKAQGLPAIDVTIFDDKDLRQSLVAMHEYTKRGYAVILTNEAIIYTTKETIDAKLTETDIIAAHAKHTKDKLWTVTPDDTGSNNDKPAQANHVIHHAINANYVSWMHATMGSPTISTFVKAIARGALRNIPRLTTNIVRKNPPHTRATAMGHMDNTRAHTRSTNPARNKAKKAQDIEVSQTQIDDSDADNEERLPGSLHADQGEDEVEVEPQHDHETMKVYYDDPDR